MKSVAMIVSKDKDRINEYFFSSVKGIELIFIDNFIGNVW
jgi:hypothetical protein